MKRVNKFTIKRIKLRIIEKKSLPCCPEFIPQISGIAWPVFVVIVKISWQRPPLISVVRAGAFVVNCSKSSLISQTAKKILG